MRAGRPRRSALALGWLLGCGPTPDEVTTAADGTEAPPTTTASTSASPTPEASSAADDATAEGSGGATGQSADASSGTTQGVEPGNGETASTGVVDPGTSTGAVDPGTTSGDPGPSTGEPPSCDALYGSAPGYVSCLETDDECHFAAATNWSDCNAMCAMFGGACIDAFDNSDGCSVIRPDIDTCDTDRGTEICVCSR